MVQASCTPMLHPTTYPDLSPVFQAAGGGAGLRAEWPGAWGSLFCLGFRSLRHAGQCVPTPPHEATQPRGLSSISPLLNVPQSRSLTASVLPHPPVLHTPAKTGKFTPCSTSLWPYDQATFFHTAIQMEEDPEASEPREPRPRPRGLAPEAPGGPGC